jgi:hypothetical protein
VPRPPRSSHIRSPSCGLWIADYPAAQATRMMP